MDLKAKAALVTLDGKETIETLKSLIIKFIKDKEDKEGQSEDSFINQSSSSSSSSNEEPISEEPGSDNSFLYEKKDEGDKGTARDFSR